MIADVYIETSIRWNEVKTGVVGIAISIEDPEDARSFFGKVSDCSETRAVLLGLKNALGFLDQAEEIRLNISCLQVASAFLNDWPSMWQIHEFKNKKGVEIKNRDVWEEITKLLKNRKVMVKYKEFNGYRNWLLAECARRAQKYEPSIRGNLSNCKTKI